MTTFLRNLAIALIVMLITVLAWLTDPGKPEPCATVNDDVAATLLANTEDSEAMMTVPLVCVHNVSHSRKHQNPNQASSQITQQSQKLPINKIIRTSVALGIV